MATLMVVIKLVSIGDLKATQPQHNNALIIKAVGMLDGLKKVDCMVQGVSMQDRFAVIKVEMETKREVYNFQEAEDLVYNAIAQEPTLGTDDFIIDENESSLDTEDEWVLLERRRAELAELAMDMRGCYSRRD